MASGPLPPGGAHTGLKLFVYGMGRTTTPGAPEVSFLAQVVQTNETGTLTATVKTDASTAGVPATEAANVFVSLLITSLASFIPK